MSKIAVRRILATVLTFTMMWGMCLSVSAAPLTNEGTCDEKFDNGNYFLNEQFYFSQVDSFDDFGVNWFPAGTVVIETKDLDKRMAVYEAFEDYEEHHFDCNAPITDTDGSYIGTKGCSDSCGCSELYDAFLGALDAYYAVARISDGSEFSGYDEPCTPSEPSSSTPASSSSVFSSSNEATVEEVVKTPENDLATFMEATTADVSKALEQINAAVATGDSAKAEALKAEGVTIDTGVWHSYNLSVYEQIEKSGIPVTLTFTYDHKRWKVTIPAGAKVTELCDEKGWCGFLNLAAHYGFELL